MAVQFRAPSAGTGSALTVTPTLPTGWQPGDILFYIHRIGAANQIATQTSGRAWNFQFQASDAAGGYTYLIAWQKMASGDTAPVFTWSGSNAFVYAMGGLYSDSGNDLEIHAWAAELDTGTSVNSVTPNSATVYGAGYASVILTCGRAATETVPTSYVYTPPSGWTAPAGGQAWAGSANSRFAAFAYQLGLTGSVSPGAQTLTDSSSGTYFLSVAHALVGESSTIAQRQHPGNWVRLHRRQSPVIYPDSFAQTISGALTFTADTILADQATQSSPLIFTSATGNLIPNVSQQSSAGFTGSSFLTGNTVQGSGTGFGGSATLSPSVVQNATASFPAASTWTSKVTQLAGTAFSTASSLVLNGFAGVSGVVTFAAQSVFSTVATQIAKIDLSSLSSLTGNVTQGSSTSMSGASSLGTVATQIATNAFTAASSFTGKAVQIVGVAFDGVASLILNAGGSVTGTITMAANAVWQSNAVQNVVTSFNPSSSFSASATTVSVAVFNAVSSFTSNALIQSKVTFTNAATATFNGFAGIGGTISFVASSVWQSSAVQQAVTTFSGSSSLAANVRQLGKLALSPGASLVTNAAQSARAAFNAAATFTGDLSTGVLFGYLKAGGRAIGGKIGGHKAPDNKTGGKGI